MNLASALKTARRAVRVNLLPGLLLQGILLIFLSLYLWHEETREALGHVSLLKEESGYAFAFVSYVISAALLPELLQICFFQRGRMMWRNVRSFLTAAPLWGCIGMLVDLFYRLQGIWFGTGNDLGTVLSKMVVDQFLYSPLINTPICVIYFFWRDGGFRSGALQEILRPAVLMERVFAIQVAGWCIWIPGVCLVYFMPPALQIPVAVLIQCFWVLIFTVVNRPAVTGG